MPFAVAQCVAAQRFEIGHKRIVAAVGQERTRRELMLVVPARKTASRRRRGIQSHRVGIGARECAATCHRAVTGVVGGSGHSGRAAKTAVRLNADNSHILQVERTRRIAAGAARRGIQRADGIVAVAPAAPAPVDVELAAVVVAVAHKAVPAGRVASAVEDRTAGIQLAHQQRAPVGIAVVVYRHLTQAALILKVRPQSIFRRRLEGVAVGVSQSPAAAIGRHVVVHLHRHAHMVHQGRHGRPLGSGARTGQLRRHACPGISRRAEIGAQRAVVGMGVRVRPMACGGMVPVLHHLRHGRGHTACHRALAQIAVVRTKIVVILRLVPRSGQQRRYRSVLRRVVVALQQIHPRPAALVADALHPPRSEIAIVENLALVVVEPPLDIRGHVLCHERARSAVAQDRQHTVVSRHDDEPLAVAAGKDIKGRVGSRAGDVHQLQILCPLGLEKRDGSRLRLRLVHRRRRHKGADRQDGRNQQQ